MSAQRKQDVDALLADLSFESNPGTTGQGAPRPSHRPATKGGEDVQSLLDDLEGLVQRRRSHGEPREPQGLSVRGTPERRVSGRSALSPSTQNSQVLSPKPLSTPSPGPSLKAEAPAQAETRPPPPAPAQEAPKPKEASAPELKPAEPAAENASSWGQWGGSLFSNATRFADQARHELERRAAAVVQKAPNEVTAPAAALEQPIHDISNRFAQGFRGLVRDAGLESLGQNLTAAGRRGWNDIVSAVAPPMEAHESVDVTLSHDMTGYDGIETLAFKVLSRMLQQADITKVDVHMAAASGDASNELPAHALHIAASREAGIAEAKAAIVPLAQAVPAPKEKQENEMMVPDSTCPIVLRLQPFYEAIIPGSDADLFGASEPPASFQKDKRSVSFLVWWVDPTYRLSHATCSQAIPAWWRTYYLLTTVSVPLENNAWVEQAMCDVIEGALAVVAQSRLTAFTQAITAAKQS